MFLKNVSKILLIWYKSRLATTLLHNLSYIVLFTCKLLKRCAKGRSCYGTKTFPYSHLLLVYRYRSIICLFHRFSLLPPCCFAYILTLNLTCLSVIYVPRWWQIPYAAFPPSLFVGYKIGTLGRQEGITAKVLQVRAVFIRLYLPSPRQ